MDDYYDMLGVDADASTDEIRAAYREMKQGLDNSSEDSAKSRKARLNKAWNVLSDPYQRGRYDAELERGVMHDDGGLDDDEEMVRTNGSKASRAPAAKGQRGQRQARQIAPPTIQPPEGLRYPQTKQRMIAMAIDLVVLFVLFVGSQFLVVSLQKSNEREAYDARKELVENSIPKADDELKAAKDDLKKAQGATPVDQKAVDAAQAQVDKAQQKKDGLNHQLSEAEKKLAPISQLISGIVFFLGFLYLVVPSMVTGATLGKRTQHLKVYREDGTPARNSDLIKRYGLLVLATYALSFVLGPIAAAIVLFVVTMWTRNPNQQGLHDRFCHTVVLTDAQ